MQQQMPFKKPEKNFKERLQELDSNKELLPFT